MKALITLTCSVFLCLSAMAQAPCSDPGFKSFDFWVGEWNVYSNGKLSGTSKITKVLNDCVLHEAWKGTSGSNGFSYNSYNPKTKKWMQTWVDNSGSTIHFEGEFEDNILVMKADAPNGEQFIMSFEAKENGNVEQIWKQSAEGRTVWSELFRGLYVDTNQEKPE